MRREGIFRVRFHLTIATLLLSVTAAYAQHAGHHVTTTKQLSDRATRNANQALERTIQPSAAILPDADAKNPAPADTNQPYDPGSIHYPYGRASLGTVDPASRANPYGPYSTPSDSTYGHYSGPALPQTPSTLFGNPAPAFALPSPSFAPNSTPAFSPGH